MPDHRDATVPAPPSLRRALALVALAAALVFPAPSHAKEGAPCYAWAPCSSGETCEAFS